MNDGHAICEVFYWPNAHGGPGYYYVDAEYPDEGSVGPFAKLAELCDHARSGEYHLGLSKYVIEHSDGVLLQTPLLHQLAIQQEAGIP